MKLHLSTSLMLFCLASVQAQPLPWLQGLWLEPHPSTDILWQSKHSSWLSQERSNWQELSYLAQYDLAWQDHRLDFKLHHRQASLDWQDALLQQEQQQMDFTWLHQLHPAWFYGIHLWGAGLGLGNLNKDQFVYLARSCPFSMQQWTLSWQEVTLDSSSNQCSDQWQGLVQIGSAKAEIHYEPITLEQSWRLTYGNWYYQLNGQAYNLASQRIEKENLVFESQPINGQWRSQQMGWQGQTWWASYQFAALDSRIRLRARVSDPTLDWLAGGRIQVRANPEVSIHQLAMGNQYNNWNWQANLLKLELDGQILQFRNASLIPIPKLERQIKLAGEQAWISSLGLGYRIALPGGELGLQLSQVIPLKLPDLQTTTDESEEPPKSKQPATKLGSGLGIQLKLKLQL